MGQIGAEEGRIVGVEASGQQARSIEVITAEGCAARTTRKPQLRTHSRSEFSSKENSSASSSLTQSETGS